MDTQNELPDELAKALKDTEEPIALITARVDREIESQATQHFASRQRRISRPAWAAIAASILVALVFGVTFQQRLSPVELYSDIDGSGQIDIADVLAAAQSNRDFSEDELDAFARSLVRLDGDSS